MDLALVVNPAKPSSLQVLERVRAVVPPAHHLKLWSGSATELRARPDYRDQLRGFQLTDDVRQSDVVVALGGDGTMLRAVHLLQGAERPLLGINLGSLGFLTDTPSQELEAAFERLLAGRYELDLRMLLEVVHHPHQGAPQFMTALNEVVLSHGPLARMLEVSMLAAGVDLGTTLADGIIVATPSGSTAYSLSAGGPVVSPRLRAFVVTPISPHTLSMRPLVVSDDETLELELVRATDEPAQLILDGRAGCAVQVGERTLVRRAPRDLQLVKTRNVTFYDTLRTKLGWGHRGRGGASAERY